MVMHGCSSEKHSENIIVLIELIVLLGIRVSISRSGMLLFKSKLIIMLSFLWVNENWVSVRDFFEHLFGSYYKYSCYLLCYFYQYGTWEPMCDKIFWFLHRWLSWATLVFNSNLSFSFNSRSPPSFPLIFYHSSLHLLLDTHVPDINIWKL